MVSKIEVFFLLRKKKYKRNIELNPNKLIELIDKQKLRINFKLLIKSLLFSDYLSIK